MAKKRDTFGDSPLGSGGRFAECVREMEKRPDVYDPAGLCASIGRKAYGTKRFAKMAERGRERGNPSTREEREWLELREKASRMREHFSNEGRDKLAFYVQGWEDAIKSLWRIVARGSATREPGTGKITARAFARLFSEETSFLRSNPKPLPRGGSTWSTSDPSSLFDPAGTTGDIAVELWYWKDGEPEDSLIWTQTIREVAQQDPSPVMLNALLLIAIGQDDIEWDETPGDPTSGWYLAKSRTQSNPCGAGGYGPAAGLEELEAAAAANPVKPDGRWHISSFDLAKTHKMTTAKGTATCFPYKPRKYGAAVGLANFYERLHRSKGPAGTKWLLWMQPRGGSELSSVTAHKTLDKAKRAGESALRKLPEPGERHNPAELIGAGILAGSAPIPSGIDSPRVGGGILAGSRPIPSGFRDPRVNVGLVDPPLTRRSKPDQPT